ncbi:endonuclease MutS2 [Acidithrix ferrooxidans]|uniref:Endonuclease MutS2 n=2 Tax=Acidithrix ferrooxidans TaxID=1280514 RepID=A0A0D8HPN6_9ACTN|nr:endonuclease MutS2 [Acidithrix ferrooxidans]
MKAHLMFRDKDFNLLQPLPPNEHYLVHDLDLDTLLGAMAGGDEFLLKVSRVALLNGLTNPTEIAYRQSVLDDCSSHSEIVRQIYEIAVKALFDKHKMFWFTRQDSPTGMMAQSPQVIGMFMGYLKQLRKIVDEHGETFSSEGWTTLFRVLKEELSDDYFSVVDDNLNQLKFRDGTLISAKLTFGNTGMDYVLRDSRNTKQSLKERLGVGGRKSYSFDINSRDEAGMNALNVIMSKGMNSAANSLTQAADHLTNFFAMLRTELAFFVAALNLKEILSAKNEPTCNAVAKPWSPPLLNFIGLYDVCLSLRSQTSVIGNDANADDNSLVVITGANSGGKSTFLRSVGVALVMMRSGMFVPAKSFTASVCEGLFTHFVREEDSSMTSGKLDEELARMSEVVDAITPKCIVLLNESFSATNEREGSEIAYQVIRALIDSDVRTIVVTHLSELALRFYQNDASSALFLQAGRQGTAGRNFKLTPGEPLSTSYGEDVYNRIGGW